MKQVVEGLLYLHSHGILHRDLTLANLLLTKEMDVVSLIHYTCFKIHCTFQCVIEYYRIALSINIHNFSNIMIHIAVDSNCLCFAIFQKIADFGLATQLVKPDEKHFTMCGTPNYISP